MSEKHIINELAWAEPSNFPVLTSRVGSTGTRCTGARLNTSAGPGWDGHCRVTRRRRRR